MATPNRPRFRPSRGRGQNFLRSPDALERVVAAIGPRAEDDFLEIGAGTGELTLPLASKAHRVVAVESDPRLVEVLSRAKASRHAENIEVIEGDFLKLDLRLPLEARGLRRPRVVGNLPYRAGSAILLRILSHRARVEDATFMLQKEVAERLTANPGTKAYGFLSVVTQQAARVTQLLTLPPDVFKPRPKVWSSLVRLDFKREAEPPIVDPETFAALVSGLLAHRRKTIANNIRALRSPLLIEDGIRRGLSHLGIDLDRRAETLTVEEFAALSHFCTSIR